MVQKICLKCLDTKYSGEYCKYCGEKLVEFNLLCECGEEISPSFWTEFFRPWRKQVINKHCSSCGENIEKRVWDYIKTLKKMV